MWGVWVQTPGVLYLGVMCAHGTCAPVWAPWVALMRVWECVILHFIIPGLHMECWGAIPEGGKGSWNQDLLVEILKLKKKII